MPGVAEVAPVGAYVKQYQVTLDPDKLLAYKIPINRVVERVRQGNQEVGAESLNSRAANTWSGVVATSRTWATSKK